jgi:hypothetical protein
MISPIATKQEETRLQPAAPATGAALPHIGKRGQMTHKSVRAQTVEAWAGVIHDLMYLAPPEKRREILERVLEIGESDNPALVCAADIRPDAARTLAKMRIKSAIVYSFVRAIVNSNSPEQAAQLLFQRHNRVAGCGALDAYLDVLPNKYIRVNRPSIANLKI